MFRSRFVAMLLVSLVLLGALLMPVGASAQGNSEAAHLCQDGGYLNYDSGNGIPFKNTGQCVRYAVQGNDLVSIPVVTPDPAVTVSFTPHTQELFCIPVVHLTAFEPNTTYTVQQQIGLSSYPSFEITTNEMGDGSGSPPNNFGIFSGSLPTYQATVGDVSSDKYLVRC